MTRSIITMAIALVLSPVCAQDGKPAQEEARPCEIRTKGGSYFTGLMRGMGRIALKTKYAVMEIPRKDVTSIRVGDVEKEERDSVVTREGTIRGWLETPKEALEVNTGFGVLRIPLKQVKSLEFRSGLSGPWKLGDDWPEFVAGDPERAAAGPAFQVRMREIQSFRGTLSNLREVRFETKYAMLKVPVRDLKSLTLGNGKRDVIETAEGPFEGTVQKLGDSLDLDTGCGILTLPLSRMAGIFQSARASGFGDNFEADTIDGWTSYGGSWKTNGGRLEVTGSNNYNTVVLLNETLPTSYQLEVECQGTQGLGVLWHAQNQSAALALWINQNQIFVLGGASWWNWQQLAQWQVVVPANEFYRVRLEVNGEATTVFIGEKQVGSVNTPGAKGGKVGLFCYNGTAKFDNFWVR